MGDEETSLCWLSYIYLLHFLIFVVKGLFFLNDWFSKSYSTQILFLKVFLRNEKKGHWQLLQLGRGLLTVDDDIEKGKAQL